MPSYRSLTEAPSCQPLTQVPSYRSLIEAPFCQPPTQMPSCRSLIEVPSCQPQSQVRPVKAASNQRSLSATHHQSLHLSPAQLAAPSVWHAAACGQVPPQCWHPSGSPDSPSCCLSRCHVRLQASLCLGPGHPANILTYTALSRLPCSDPDHPRRALLRHQMRTAKSAERSLVGVACSLLSCCHTEGLRPRWRSRTERLRKGFCDHIPSLFCDHIPSL